MSFEHQITNNIYILAPGVDLLSTKVSLLEKHLDDALKLPDLKAIIINLNDVDMVDSQTLGLFVSTFKTLGEKDAKFILCDLTKTVLDILKAVVLDEVFTIISTERRALESLED